MPGLAGFLEGFNKTTGEGRQRQLDEGNAAFERDQHILSTLADNSERDDVREQAMAGLMSMARGDYNPKNGLARFLGTPGKTPVNPQVMGVLNTLRSTAQPSGGSAGLGTPPPPTAPAGETAAMPPKPVTAGGGPGSSAVVGSPGGPTSPTEAPVTGGMAAALTAPSGSPAASPETAPPPPKPAAAPAPAAAATPVQAPATGAVGGPPPAPTAAPAGGGAPSPTARPAPATFQTPRPPLAAGQYKYSPEQGKDIAEQRTTSAAAMTRQNIYNQVHDEALASLKVSDPNMSPEEMEAHANMYGLRAANPGVVVPPHSYTVQNAIGPDGMTQGTQQYYLYPDGTTAPGMFTPTVARAPMNAFNEFMGSAKGLGQFFPAGTPVATMQQRATPAQREAADTAWQQFQASGAGQRTSATQAQEIIPVTGETGAQTLQRKGALVGPGGPPPTPGATGITATPTAPTKPVVAGGGVGGPPPPLPTGPVGSNPQHPEAPMAVGPQQATPQGVPSTTPASAPPPAVPGQVKPSPALDPQKLANYSALGQPFDEEDRIGTGPQAQFTRKAAEAQGIPVLAKDDAAIIKSIGAARQNNADFLSAIGPYLADDAAQRPGVAFGNWIAEKFQTNPVLAGLAARWGSAVADVKSTGVSRTNNAEINKGLQAMPEMSDTLPVALEKVKAMGEQFLNMENAILPLPPQIFQGIKSGQLLPDPQKQPNGITVTIKSNGQQWHIDTDGTPHRLK